MCLQATTAVDVNQAADTGNTPLHAAANGGNFDVVKVLVHCPGIQVDCINKQCENATPLHLAVMHGQLLPLTYSFFNTIFLIIFSLVHALKQVSRFSQIDNLFLAYLTYFLEVRVEQIKGLDSRSPANSVLRQFGDLAPIYSLD